MPGTNRLAAYSMMMASVLVGGGSLVLFGAFLAVGPFAPFRFHASQGQVLLWDGFLSLLFFIQHSGMVRKSSRIRLARILASPYHPSAYSIASGIALATLVILWQPTQTVLYKVEGPVRLLFAGAFLLAVLGFYRGVQALGNFDTFGLDPIRAYLKGSTLEPSGFRVRGPYFWVRHPLYFFMLVLIWSSFHVTSDRLLFSVTWTLWVVLSTYLEEKDLVADFGDAYRRYQRTVPMLLPCKGPVGRAVGE
ncbi:MAG: isoprenylcysteine carboxylmethyltransferase family protein [Armatimonadota bacterium]